MISSSGMRGTGEKKCRPMNCSGRSRRFGKPGDRQGRRVGREQRARTGRRLGLFRGRRLDCRGPRTPPRRRCRRRPALRSARVGWMRASVALRLGVDRAAPPRRRSPPASRARRGRAARPPSLVSTIMTCMPARAHTSAMPLPIRPAPSTPTRRNAACRDPAGRPASRFAAATLRPSVRTMSCATGPRATSTNACAARFERASRKQRDAVGDRRVRRACARAARVERNPARRAASTTASPGTSSSSSRAFSAAVGVSAVASLNSLQRRLASEPRGEARRAAEHAAAGRSAGR